jgi:1-acyl-sn-glycerol-3-phosphate acyltransferase
MIRAVLRLAVYLLFSLACMPVQAALLRFNPAQALSFPCWYHRRCLQLFGIRVEVVGEPAAAKPCLFVANHSSYLDIPVLGSILPTSFVAKAEVAGWPLFGTLAKLQRTLFIDRRPSQVGNGQSAMAQRLTAGDNLVLFPEGTSSDGVRVLPFRRALFQTALEHAEGLKLSVQPVSVFCVGMNGVVADRAARQTYAWYGDMELLPHLWRFCQLRSAVVRVIFHPVLDVTQAPDRQALAAIAEQSVAGGLAA